MSASGNTRTGFEDCGEIHDPDGVVAVLSRRRSNGAVTAGFFKVFERDGSKEKTNFIPVKLFPALTRVMVLAAERIAELEATPVSATSR